MANRSDNYSRTEDRKDFVITDNVEEALDYLETQGKLKPKVKLKQSLINPRCLKYYNNVIDINKILKTTVDETERLVLKEQKKAYQTKIINLCSIVIGSTIKRFKTLYPVYFQEVYTEAVLEVLQKIDKNKYDSNKSAFHSYVYETTFQSNIKYLAAKSKYENSTVDLLQD